MSPAHRQTTPALQPRRGKLRRGCAVLAKSVRWSVASAISLLSPMRRIVLDDVVYFIPRTDDYIARQLVRHGSYHQDRLEDALRLLQIHGNASPGLLLNLGAHVGTALIPLLQTGRFPAALAVEPAPQNAACLLRNLATNGLSQLATVAEVAIGDRTGEALLHLSRTNTANHTLCEGKLAWHPHRPTVLVNIMTIDALLQEQGIRPPEVRLVVMDLQGYEGLAIAGGETLFKHAPPLMMEIDRHFLDSRDKVRLLRRNVARFYQTFFDLDDVTLTPRDISQLEAYCDTYTGYRDFFLV